MRALITGISGQDGAYLAKFLLGKGYDVFGLKRRLSTPNLWRLDVLGITDKVTLIDGDMVDMSSLHGALDKSQPDEIYNLAAQSFVPTSFESPISTFDVNAKGVLNLLESIRLSGRNIKFYQASTSEMFGLVNVESQDESTPFHPRSPYGVSKVAAHYATINYREAYGMHACCGILFNHESPLRGEEFVTRKVTEAVKRIKQGKQDKLLLGNLDAKRDWGHAEDYVKAMWLMLQNAPDEYVIATGKTYSVREFVSRSFDTVGLDYHDYVIKDERYMRPSDVPLLCGNPQKAIDKLGWKPEYSFESLIAEMVLGKVRMAA